MRKRRFAAEQITRALRKVEAGRPVADLCRQQNLGEATFYPWKKQFRDIGVAKLRELRMLREQNKKSKHLVSDPTLDKQILREAPGKQPCCVPR